jgi:hypothetical protein
MCQILTFLMVSLQGIIQVGEQGTAQGSELGPQGFVEGMDSSQPFRDPQCLVCQKSLSHLSGHAEDHLITLREELLDI